MLSAKRKSEIEEKVRRDCIRYQLFVNTMRWSQGRRSYERSPKMYKQVELNCQNFECDSNKGGDCLQGNVQMRPVTEKGLQIDRLICVQATRKEKTEKEKCQDHSEKNQ